MGGGWWGKFVPRQARPKECLERVPDTVIRPVPSAPETDARAMATVACLLLRVAGFSH